MTPKLTVVFMGSGGKQGGAVTRERNSIEAKSLANAGAALIVASLEHAAAIRKTFEWATCLFAVTAPSGGTRAALRREFSDVAFHNFE